MSFVLVINYRGVNERVAVDESAGTLEDKVRRWEPALRLGRINWQNFGYKSALVSEDGLRTYEIFSTS